VARRLAVRPEEIRRHNLSLLLRHIHQHGELTRVELTAATGLNRSTIGALVSDLVALGLVSEYVPSGRDRAGRPSHVVAPRSDGPYVLAVDVAPQALLAERRARIGCTCGLRRSPRATPRCCSKPTPG